MLRMPSVHSSPRSTCSTMDRVATSPTSVGQVLGPATTLRRCEREQQPTRPRSCGFSSGRSPEPPRHTDAAGTPGYGGARGVRSHVAMRTGFQSGGNRLPGSALTGACDIAGQTAIAVQGLQCVSWREEPPASQVVSDSPRRFH